MSTPTPESGRPQTIFKHNKFKFLGAPLQDAKINRYNQKPQEPTCEMVPNKNEWAIKIYTNGQNDTKNNGVIQSNIDGRTMYAFWAGIAKIGASALECLIKGKPVKEGLNALVIKVDGHSFVGGRRSEQPHTLSKIHIGIDDKGIYFSPRAKDRPEINFYLTGGEYHSITGRIGEVVSEGSMLESCIYAIGVSEGYLHLCAQINKDHYISWQEIKAEKEKNQQGGGRQQYNQGGGGAPRNGYNQGGQQQQAPQGGGTDALFDDDLPM